MFQIVSTGLQVNRPMTIAYLAHAVGHIPSKSDVMKELEENQGYFFDDYRNCRSIEYNALESLLNAKVGERQECLNQCLELGSLFSSLVNLQVDREDFELEVKRIRAEQVHAILFSGYEAVEKVLREGFFVAINTILSKGNWPGEDKKEVLMKAQMLDAGGLQHHFSAEACAGAADFLACCRYEDMSAEQVKMFEGAVAKMSFPERYRLYMFVTDEQYFAGTKMTVLIGVRKGSYPQAATCTRELKLPPFDDEDELFNILCAACLHMEYGYH